MERKKITSIGRPDGSLIISDENTIKTCPHVLQCKGNKVVGAPKINMDIGQLLYESHSLQVPFIRLVGIFINYFAKLHII